MWKTIYLPHMLIQCCALMDTDYVWYGSRKQCFSPFSMEILGPFCSDARQEKEKIIGLSANMATQCQRQTALFPRSEAKGKLVLFRSQQRRLRLVLLQQRGNSSVICRALSRQLHIWIDQQRGNMLVFSLCSRWFCGFRLKSKNGTVRRAGPLGGFYTIGLG